MAVTVPRGPGLDADDDLRAVAGVLDQYLTDHPGATAEAYRHGKYLVRLRVVDDRFARLTRGQRHQAVWDYLNRLPDEVASEVAYVVAITPEERGVGSSVEFDHPVTWDGELGLSITGSSHPLASANGGGLSITGSPPADSATAGQPSP